MFHINRLSILLLLMGLSGCGNQTSDFSNQPFSSSNKMSLTENNKNTLTFKIQFDSTFRIQCANCQVHYARLQIKGPNHLSVPIYALGSDKNGFVPINPENGITELSAQIPEGSNWVAYAGLYVTNQPNQEAVTEVGGVFHNPPPTEADIELSLRSLQTARIIDALHEMDSPKLLSPLDLKKYQALSDHLLGVKQQEDGSYVLGRMPALDNPNKMLDADTIANMIEKNQLDLENPEAASELPIETLLPEPKVLGGVRVQAFTAGLSKLVMNPLNDTLFSFDIKQGERSIYGFNRDDFSETFSPYKLQKLRNLYLSLGLANTDGATPVPVSYSYESRGVDRMFLEARSQQDGSLIWSHDFDDIPALYSDYVPTAWLDDQGTPETDDDQDRVYVTLNADEFNHPDKRGVHAIQNGEKLWHLAINNDFNTAGALNADGSKLHLVSRSDPFSPSVLYAVNTETGTMDWEYSLQEQTFTTSTPAIGTHGDIYVVTYQVPVDYQVGQSLPGKVQSIGSDGQLNWSFDLTSTSSFSPTIDSQNGEDIIYVFTDRSQLISLDHNGSTRWTKLLPGTAGEGPVDAPLIAEDMGNGRTLYLGIGNGLIYAVRDQENKGELLWAQSPGAKIARGMVLKNGVIYAPTLDGGEGQWVQIKAVQVHSLNLANTAPWPITGGNLQGSGISQLALK